MDGYLYTSNSEILPKITSSGERKMTKNGTGRISRTGSGSAQRDVIGEVVDLPDNLTYPSQLAGPHACLLPTAHWCRFSEQMQ
jgi:hypothetical protein